MRLGSDQDNQIFRKLNCDMNRDYQVIGVENIAKNNAYEAKYALKFTDYIFHKLPILSKLVNEEYNVIKSKIEEIESIDNLIEF